MINIGVGWYLGLLAVAVVASWALGYWCGRIDGKP